MEKPKNLKELTRKLKKLMKMQKPGKMLLELISTILTTFKNPKKS